MIYVYTLLPLIYAILQRGCWRNFIYRCQKCCLVSFRGVCGPRGVTVEQGQKNTSTCSTRSERARARPAPDPARPAPRRAVPVSPACARAYKAHQSFNRTLPRALDLTGAPDHQHCPAHVRARGHPIPRHRRPTSRALPSHARPSEETVHASVKLPEQGIGLCLAREASPRSPERIASTSSREAHRAV
jgi:hypothetical protein